MNGRTRLFAGALGSVLCMHFTCSLSRSSGLSVVELPKHDQIPDCTETRAVGATPCVARAGNGPAPTVDGYFCKAVLDQPSGSESSTKSGGGSVKAANATSGKGKSGSVGGSPAKGRIAQLLSENGAQLPVKLKALTPKLDTTLSKPTVLTGGISKSGSFPDDWHGSWSGTLTIKVFQYNPQCARFDPAEFSQTQSLMQPGISGQVKFKFTEGSDRKMELEPAQVYFSKPATTNHFRFFPSENIVDQRQSESPGPGWVKIGSIRPIAGQPFIYILHLGLFEPGTGVTGNRLSGQLLSDSVNTLSPEVVEQQVLTYESDISRLTGGIGHAFSENDIQFSAEDAGTLKVQAASVRYGPAGDFVDKVILEGEVRRDSNQDAGGF